MTGVVVTKLEIQLRDEDHWYPVLAIAGPVPGVGSAGKQRGMFLIARPGSKPAVIWIELEDVTAVRHEPPPEGGEAGVTWA